MLMPRSITEVTTLQQPWDLPIEEQSSEATSWVPQAGFAPAQLTQAHQGGSGRLQGGCSPFSKGGILETFPITHLSSWNTSLAQSCGCKRHLSKEQSSPGELQ